MTESRIHLIKAPLKESDTSKMQAGDECLVSGIIYAARDAAHRRMINALENNEKLPFDIDGQIIYYVGPCPAPPGMPVGSAGPTTSSRMDAYAPVLLDLGLKAMIGKGPRSQDVISAMIRNKAVYLAAIGGAGAYLAKRIRNSEVIAYPELGPEALYRFEVEDFPCIVAVDSQGRSLYESNKGV